MTPGSTSVSDQQCPAGPTLAFGEALRFWLKLGFISFGGPAGQIAIMHDELVGRRRWISERRFLHALNYCMVLPGPEAQQLATYIGWLMHGTRGGVVAGALFVLPSLLMLIGLSWAYLRFGNLAAVQGVVYGLKPAVTAIVVFAAYRIGSRALGSRPLKLIAAAAFLAISLLHVPFPAIILAGALAGYFCGTLAPSQTHHGDPHLATGSSRLGALIDDDTPRPAHAAFRWPNAIGFGCLGLGIWVAAELMLYLVFGWHGTLTQMGWFFSKSALLTFGGAYAVLPYVFQGSVDQYGWLTPAQMMDGLALGETTPGPLIMVVAFVGFVGGWSREVLGPDLPALGGMAGAITATGFTFLPSFVFILVGAPAVEATRGDIKFIAPLAGITAAVVGVILVLALFFAYHMLWPRGVAQPISAVSLVADGEWPAGLMALLAFVALWRFKLGVIPVIAICGIAGYVIAMAS